MKTQAFPAPNGRPANIGTIQCTFGVQVHANQSCPTASRIAPRVTMLAIASGGIWPVSGSLRWLLIILRRRGSQAIVMSTPTPMPMKDSPPIPGDQPRSVWKAMGYATKQRYRVP